MAGKVVKISESSQSQAMLKRLIHRELRGIIRESDNLRGTARAFRVLGFDDQAHNFDRQAARLKSRARNVAQSLVDLGVLK